MKRIHTPSALVLTGLVVSGLFLSGFLTVSSKLTTVRFKIGSESVLSIRGTTNVNSFECFAKQQFPEQTTRLVMNGHNRVVEFDDMKLMLRVEALDCENNRMNADLCDALKAEDFPHIVIRLHDARIEDADSRAEWVPVSVRSSLTISGQTRMSTIKARMKRMADGSLRFTADHGIKMTDYGVQPPTALLGLIKVKDHIVIHFDVTTHVSLT